MKSLRLNVIGAIVAAAAGLVLAYLFIGRGWQQWQSQRSELAELSMQVDTLSQLSTAVQEATTALASANAHELLAGRVPLHMEFETFFQQLQGHATTRGLKIMRMQHEAVARQGDLDSLPINLSAQGPLNGLYEFIGDLRHSKRLVKLEQVALLATEDPGACELQLVMRIYSAAAPEEKAGT